MNQYRLVWKTKIPLRRKVDRLNALVWNRGRWSLHLFPMTKALRRSIDSTQARFLRRLCNIKAAYISRVSHRTVRRKCNTQRFSTFIFRSQLRWLGHILRKPESDPLRRVLFQPNTNLKPIHPPDFDRHTLTKRKVGRPHFDWAQVLLKEIFRLTGTYRENVLAIAQDRGAYHRFVERLCNLYDISWKTRFFLYISIYIFIYIHPYIFSIFFISWVRITWSITLRYVT